MRTISNLIYFVLIILSSYLALLSFANVPCIGEGGCNAVLKSTFGKLFGIPIGVYALLFWGVVVHLNHGYKFVLLGFLAGCLGFIGLMVHLDSYCPFCIAHHILAFSLLFLPKPSKEALILSPVAFCIAMLMVFMPNTHKITPISTVTISTGVNISSAPTLNPFNSTASSLSILSLSCPSCLSKLADFNKIPANATKFTLLITDENKELSTYFIASALEFGDVNSGFKLVVELIAQELPNLSMPTYGLDILKSKFNVSEANLQKAEVLITSHKVWTDSNQIFSAPQVLN